MTAAQKAKLFTISTEVPEKMTVSSEEADPK